ncbi:hypothetical protein JCM9279_003583 [Rhodotorula babjevae]
MSGSVQHPEHSVQKNYDLDLTDDHDDSADPTPFTSHSLPAGAPPSYPRRTDSSSTAYVPPPGGHPSFPSSTPRAHAPQQPQHRYSPVNISQQYGAAGPSYAANRLPLLDQSIVAPPARRRSELERGQQPQPHTPQQQPVPPPRDQSSFNNTVGASLRVRGNTSYSSGPRNDQYQPRHAKAIAQAPPPASSHPRRSYPPIGHSEPRFAPTPNSFCAPPPHHQQQQPPPQQRPIVRLDHDDVDPAKSPPRKDVLPPGFPPPTSTSHPTFSNTFQPESRTRAAVADPHAPLDLVSPTLSPRSPPPHAPPPHQHFGAAPITIDMSRNAKGTPITPRDPSMSKSFRGAGWNNGFDNDDDEVGRAAPSRQDKGKGRAAPSNHTTPVFMIPNPGRGGSQAAALRGMTIKKNAQSAVSSTTFHDSPVASTSRTGHPAGGSSSASRQRVMHQDDPQTAQEMRGEAEKKQQEKLAKAAKKKQPAPAATRAPAAANGTTARGRGKKKAPEVLELSSSGDDDDDDDDPIRTSDDDRGEGSSRAQAHPHASTSTSSRPTLHVKGAAAAQARQQQQQAQHPQRGDSDGFSPDELAIGAQVRSVVDVRKRVAEYEQKGNGQGQGQGKASVASSLKPKTKPQPRVDGGPTDGGELDMFATASTAGKKVPRAAQASIDKGKAKLAVDKDAVDKLLQDQVKMLPIEAFLVGRQHVPADHRDGQYKLLYNQRGKPKITVRRKGLDDAEDVCDFGQKDVSTVLYNDDVGDGKTLYLEFLFKKTSKVFEQLAQACDCSSEAFDAGSRTVVFPISGTLAEDWDKKTGSSAAPMVDQVFKLCINDWKATKAAKGPAGATKGVLDRCRDDADDLADKLSKRAGKQSSKGKQSQQKLPFGPAPPVAAKAPRLHTDAAGDYVELDSSAGPRRSSRASTSAFAGHGQVAAARELAKPRSPSPFGAEEVVLEYPPNEPGAVSLTWGDTKRLRDEEFLNDTLIEFGLKRIIKSIEERDQGLPDDAKLAPQIHVFNSFFYKQLSSKKDAKRGLDPYLLVEKWTKRVDLFKKRYIVVPINEYMHWYLAIVVNPAAILEPPPPAPPPAAPRKSGRKRNGTVDSDYVVDSPGGSPEVASKHFSGAGRSLREPDAEDKVDEEDEDDEAARRATEKVARDVEAHEQRKAHQHDREVQAAVASVAEQKRRASSSVGPADEMDLDDGARAGSSSAAVVGSSPQARTQPSNGAEDDEPMLDVSSESPPPPGQADVNMRGADDMSADDADVTRVRPEVEGGGPGQPSKHVLMSPSRSQGQHKRFADDDDDDDVVVQEQPHKRAAAPASDTSDASLDTPDKLGKGKQRLRRGPKKDAVDVDPPPPPPEHAKQLERITLDDDEDESLPGAGDPAPTSAPMQNVTSSSSAGASTSSSSTSTCTPTAAAADAEPASRSAPPSTTYGSSSSSRPRKSVVGALAPMPFTPQDPEPDREAQLAREREEEEERRCAREAEEDVEMVEEVTSSANRCWILTFDSLGAPHKQVANRVKDYLRREAASKRGVTDTSWERAEAVRVEVPQQPNSCDCGLYLLHFVETFFKNPQLLTDTAVSAHLAAKSKTKDKGKKDLSKKEVESQAFDLWEGNVAQQKRAVMRAEVDELRKAWQKDMEPLREKERLEREERKRQQRDRKAAERAAVLEDEEQQQHERQRRQSSSAAAAAAPPRTAVEPSPDRAPLPPPPAAQSPATSRVPRVAQPLPARTAPPAPPPPPPSSFKKASSEVKMSAHDELILSDSESAPTSSSHPVAEQASTTLTAAPPIEQVSYGSPSLAEQQRQHHRQQPPVADSVASSSSSTKRRREPQGGGPALGLDARIEHFSFPPPSPRPEPAPAPAHSPAPAPGRINSPELGVVDSQSLPRDKPSSDERRPSKKVKVRHDSARAPFSLPGSQSGEGLVDYLSASDDERDSAAAVAVAVAQEVRAPAPPAAPASTPGRPPATSSNFLPTRGKSKEIQTVVLDDEDEDE